MPTRCRKLPRFPHRSRKQLENDIEFEQTEAGLYAAAGDLAHATDYMNRVQAHYVKLKTLPPPSVDVENAWLLYNTGNDRALYLSLMRTRRPQRSDSRAAGNGAGHLGQLERAPRRCSHGQWRHSPRRGHSGRGQPGVS